MKRLKISKRLKHFLRFARSRDWRPGKTKHVQTHDCFLRAVALGILPDAAFMVVVACIKGSGGTLDLQQVERQCRRAYEYVVESVMPAGAIRGHIEEEEGECSL